MQRFRDGLVFKAHRLFVSLNSRLESNKEEEEEGQGLSDGADSCVAVGREHRPHTVEYDPFMKVNLHGRN